MSLFRASRNRAAGTAAPTGKLALLRKDYTTKYAPSVPRRKVTRGAACVPGEAGPHGRRTPVAATD
jgi:hypothetical protein